MARTIEQIEQELSDNRPTKIKTLAVDRITSVLGAIFYAVAFAIHTLEKLFDTHKTVIEEVIVNQQPGTLDWYADKIKNEFKGFVPYSIQKGKLVFSDAPAKFTVSRVSINTVIEGTGHGLLKIKVAKGEVGSESPLTEVEKLNLEQYIADMKYAGTKVEVTTRVADTLRVDAAVYYHPSYALADMRTKVNTAMSDYIKNLRFDGKVYVSEIEDKLRHIEGVKDVVVSAVYVSDVAVSRVTDVSSGYLVEHATSKFATTITLTAEY